MLIFRLFYLLGLACVWTVLFAFVLAIVSIFHLLAWALLLPLWCLLLLFSVFFYIAPLRRLFITRPFLKIARKAIPPMSDTEREASEAGGVWWEAELFCGRPNWKKLHAINLPKMSQEEQSFIDGPATTLCEMLDDWQITYEDSDLSPKVWDYIKKECFFAMAIPKKYGGLEFSAIAQSTIVGMIATRSVSAAVNVMVPNSLGPAELLIKYGTEKQRQQFLPKLAVGKDVPCFALTSTHAGSDAVGMQDHGVICKGQYEGKEVLGMRVSWKKRYITLAPVATLLGLAIKVFDPDHLLGDKEELGITVCLVPTDYPGVETGRRHFPVFHAFQNGPTEGHDVFMPLDFIVGGQESIGKGWRMLMDCLSVGRAISLPALNVGATKLCYRMTGAYAKLREQFRLSIGKFEGVAEAMGDIAGFNYIAEATRIMTAGGVDLGIKPSLCSAIAKYHLTEMGRTVSTHAMDIHSGRGIQAGPRNYLVNGFMGMPVGITVEGANILTRNLMIFGQGAVRCHPYAAKEMEAVNLPDRKQALKTFDKLMVKHANYVLRNIARSFLYGLGFDRFACAPVKGPTKHYYRKLTRLSTALAFTSDMAMSLLGGKLKRMENVSARLGDVLSYLYMASCTLKYYEDSGAHKDDLPHVDWAVQYCIYECQEALMGFYANFPRRISARFMRLITFPFGRRFHPPKDRLNAQLADFMMKPSEFRDRVTAYCFVGKDDNDPTGRVENTFQAFFKVEPLLKKVRSAEKAGQLKKGLLLKERLSKAVELGILTADEAKQVDHFEAMRLDAMQVDDFPADYIGRKQSRDQ